MDSGKIETAEVSKPDVVDVLNGRYQFHWTSVEKLPEIISKGLYSPKFAERIKNEDYQIVRPSEDRNSVYVTADISEHWGGPFVVGIIVDVPQKDFVSLRIGPKQFRGLVVREMFPQESDVFRKHLDAVSNIAQSSMSNRSTRLVIYGTSGDLLWSQRMSHQKIVGMLAERQK